MSTLSESLKPASDTEVLVFRFALAPNKTQEAKLLQHEGAARAAFNRTVEMFKAEFDEYNANPFAEKLSYSLFSVRKRFNAIKKDDFPWHKAVSQFAFDTGIANAHSALDAFFKSRRDPNALVKRFPRFKAKGRDICAIAFNTVGAERRVDPKSKHHFYLPNLGRVRLHQKTGVLKWLTHNGGVIKTCLVKRQGRRWYMSVRVTVPAILAKEYHLSRVKKKTARAKAVGVDLGLEKAFVFSDGLVIENPRNYRKLLDKLRRENQALSRKKNGSKARERQRKRVNRVHEQIRHRRSNFIHKITKQLATEYETIGIETLHVQSMLKRSSMSISVMDAAFGTFAEQLQYKANFYGATLVRAPRFYPSSKTCSNCGLVRSKLTLRDRVFNCDSCGISIDRDLNAAVNLMHYALGLRVGCDEMVNRFTTGEELSTSPVAHQEH